MSARTKALAACLFAACALLAPSQASAQGGAVWRSEQPTPAGSKWPVGLGKVGDIAFEAPNRGLLITSGVPPTIAPGVWAYNGVEWHMLSNVCGATDGSIAWEGPDEFWTVSDGRAGQSGGTGTLEQQVPLEDNTLCHFSGGQVVGSYAHPAFQADSYQAMHAAACLGSGDCWFGGDALPEPQVGAFHLHWNGTSVEEEPYPAEGHAVESMQVSEGRIYESVRVARNDPVDSEQSRAPVVHRINPAGVLPAFEPENQFGQGLPLYGPTEISRGLEYLRLSASEETLWAATGRKFSEPEEEEHEAGQVTLATREGGNWTQLLGAQHPLGRVLPESQAAEEGTLLGGEAKHAEVTALGAEPGTESAWLALADPKGKAISERAVLVRVASNGQVLEEQTLPSAREEEEGIGPKGAATQITCPEDGDCWMVTAQGWIFHLAPEGERTLPLDEDPSFLGPITYRPPDQGLPQVPPDAPPPDTSGIVEESVVFGTKYAEAGPPKQAQLVTLPLLSGVHSKLLHHDTLELRFHLAVKAKVKLVAQRKRKVVASTAMHTFAAGNRKLVLRLNPHAWPTNLKLQTHALAPLPEVQSATGGLGNVSTRLVTLPRTLLAGGSGLLP